MLKAALGVQLTHVPYKGMQPAISDVAGGHIPMTFSPIPIALPMIQAGKVRADRPVHGAAHRGAARRAAAERGRR